MIYPNAACADFCYWMLNISWQRLTAPRLNVINTVYNAAVSATSVTDQQWSNFNQVTAWRYPYYRVYLDNANYYSTQALAYFGYLPQVPSLAYKQAVNTFIAQCITDGNWSLLDRFVIYPSGSIGNAGVSLINPSQNVQTFSGGYTYNASTGITGNGTNAFINSQFTPSVDGSNVTLNSACYGVYYRTNRAGAAYTAFGCTSAVTNNPTLFLSIRAADNNEYGFIHNNIGTQSAVSAANTVTQGMHVLVRESSSVLKTYSNGSVVINTTLTSAAMPVVPVTILGYNNAGTVQFFDPGEVSAWYCGSGAINQLALYNAFQTLATSLGFNV